MGAKFKLGHMGLIRPEVDLMNTILRTSSRLNGEWALVEEGECNALLLYNAEKSFEPYVINPNTQLIMIRRRGQSWPGHVLLKPFRADELVDTLISIQENGENPAVVVEIDQGASRELYRLKKWPTASLLSQDKNYTLLAVYLSRGSKTVENLVTLSGQSEKFCEQFLEMLKARNLIALEGPALDRVQGTAVPVQQTIAKKTFLSSLKARLGLSKL